MLAGTPFICGCVGPLAHSESLSCEVTGKAAVLPVLELIRLNSVRCCAGCWCFQGEFWNPRT